MSNATVRSQVDGSAWYLVHKEGGAQSVERIAKQCGYRTVESFRIAFSNHLGLPPSAYRERFGKHGKKEQTTLA